MLAVFAGETGTEQIAVLNNPSEFSENWQIIQ